ncbi:MAG TPA: CotH kinase family protein, partial [Kiritimatiellia bacterium]|nr:CotH kinase family protein [Kiritimatiellia bacterium]HRU71611.1 CotH kinase family protein [Kiritimatiellia bacterium]
MRVCSAFFIVLVFWRAISADASADILISEVLADNENGIRDEDGDRQDWLELYNSGNQSVSLEGWWLTDKPTTPTLWRLPAVTLSPGACLLIWASGKNRADPAGPLHTSFSLSKGGEYIGLYRPDPATGLPVLADDYAQGFPALPPDVSYGKLFDPATPPAVPAWNGANAFFATPTPGAVNGAGSPGPLLTDAAPDDPNVPRPLGTPDSPPLTVTVRVIPTLHAIRAVRVIPRIMFQAEQTAVVMADDGAAPDTVAGDGVYSAQLSTAALTAGQMFRWRFEVEDAAGTVTRLPAFNDPLDSPQYFGTVAVNPDTATSQLPILEWFVQNSPPDGPATEPFRGCCYYLSNFYDNVGHKIHGQTTASFPKKSYDFDFTGEDRFLWRADARRVKDINLLTNYADKTKARNYLSHWMAQMSGTPHHFVVPVRVQLNGNFHGVMDLVEDTDDRMLERNGLDPDGALYKIYGTAVAQAEKKTRKEEDKSDITALYAGLNKSSTLEQRLAFTYDNVDVAALINYRVTRLLNGDADFGEKNYCLYRDTNGTGEWQPIMWDVDLTHGHNWSDKIGYFDDTLTTNILYHANGLKSLLYDIAFYGPEFQKMFVRRLRTLMDRVLQAPGTVNGLMEQQFRAIAASIDPDPADPSPWTDGDLDAARWGFPANYAPNRPREEVERVIAEYLAPRRAFLFNTGPGRPVYNSEPFPDAPQVNAPGMVVIDSLD